MGLDEMHPKDLRELINVGAKTFLMTFVNSWQSDEMPCD